MNPKNLMTVMSAITALVGLAFIIFPTQITTMMFPAVGEEAIMVGVAHRQLLGASTLGFTICLWFMKDAEEAIAKRFLFATSLCFCLQALGILKASVIDGVIPLPIPPFALLVILSIASFYVSKKGSSDSD